MCSLVCFRAAGGIFFFTLHKAKLLNVELEVPNIMDIFSFVVPS